MSTLESGQSAADEGGEFAGKLGGLPARPNNLNLKPNETWRHLSHAALNRGRELVGELA